VDVRLATDFYGRRNAGENLLGHFPRCEAADRLLTRGNNVDKLTFGRQPSIPSRSDR